MGIVAIALHFVEWLLQAASIIAIDWIGGPCADGARWCRTKRQNLFKENEPHV